MDRISELPDHLIHHILSFIPTIDVVRMSILSRRWRQVWYSVPDLHFCDYDHIDRFHFHSQPKKAFYKFVDNCLKYRERSARYIADSFITKLRIEYYGDKPALDNWSTLTIWRNIKELDIFTEPQDFFVVYYCLPEAVLNARSLTVLKLDYLTFDGSCSISLPSLISLSLMYVKLNDEALQNLLLGCPALEKFVLTKGYGLLDPKISSLTLKFLEIIEDDHKPFKTLEFETINLQSLIYNGDRENIINLSACKAIRSLSLSDIMLRELENLICGFSLLESLTLYHCFDVKHIRICGQDLKTIRLLTVISSVVYQ
ncbi:F-box domain containing protein [Trema orientale]|uniref:F-box domain containing protein n=1 Tax=Trema orientale TaxID=63057 RepID=A0A2P5C0M3_TREOI|nr:F-box domain containing protein [Trema orientale]